MVISYTHLSRIRDTVKKNTTYLYEPWAVRVPYTFQWYSEGWTPKMVSEKRVAIVDTLWKSVPCSILHVDAQYIR